MQRQAQRTGTLHTLPYCHSRVLPLKPQYSAAAKRGSEACTEASTGVPKTETTGDKVTHAPLRATGGIPMQRHPGGRLRPAAAAVGRREALALGEGQLRVRHETARGVCEGPLRARMRHISWRERQ